MSDQNLPDQLPAQGIGEPQAFDQVAALVRDGSADLGHPAALAHMDPAPADVAARLVGLNAAYNQNLLHPDLSPFATLAERRVVQWLCPFFGMSTGHMCGGSTLANLTALWCAREHGARRVIASADAHISVAKAAHILGIPFETVAVDAAGRMGKLAGAQSDHAVVVVTAGTTGRGAIDDLGLARLSRRHGGPASWVHVDAAWAGPMRLSRHAELLAGIDLADSVAISAHKWLFQPKDSALVLFAEPRSPEAISFGSTYLKTPNVGI